eukprot:117675_1
MATKSQKIKPKTAAEKKEERADLDAKKQLGYMDSTQHKQWLFADIDIINTKRLESFKTQLQLLKQHSREFSTKYTIPTDDEYLRSLSYYAKEIIQICRKFQFPAYVSCTAVTYFKRFFLNDKYNLINTDAMCMKDTAIYLASKTEQCLFSGVDQLTQVTKIPSIRVVNHELILMDGIKFHLKIWNPFRPFRSFFSDFKIIYKKKMKTALNERYEQQIWKQGNDLIQDSFISDVCLIYTPSQIALSCLLLVISCIDIKHLTKDAEKEVNALKQMSIHYFETRFGKNPDFGKLKESTKIIQHMIIDAINKTNSNKEYKRLEKQANTKMFKLQTLYYQIKNKPTKAQVSPAPPNANGASTGQPSADTQTVKRDKKRKSKNIKLVLGKRKAKMNGQPTKKRKK